MRKIASFLAYFFLIALIGCASQPQTITYSKLDRSFQLEATRNFLPTVASVKHPAYTVYEGSKWNCAYKTKEGDSVCCLDQYSTMSPWKYCLLVDDQYSAFAFVELGDGSLMPWPEGKQSIFKPSK